MKQMFAFYKDFPTIYWIVKIHKYINKEMNMLYNVFLTYKVIKCL